MTEPHLEHNRLTVHNLDECIAFYKELFQFEIRWQGEVPSGERWVHLGNEKCYLSLSQAVANVGRRDHPETYEDFQGYTHMGWVITNISSYLRKLNEIKATGIVQKETTEAHHVYFFDPHGNEIELIEYKTT
jgi:catechol 2,3-dioxygenase-like lactoylglutathione lyase family enzyme